MFPRDDGVDDRTTNDGEIGMTTPRHNFSRAETRDAGNLWVEKLKRAHGKGCFFVAVQSLICQSGYRLSFSE